MTKSYLRTQLNLSPAVEDYVKAIYQLGEEAATRTDDRITTNEIAARLRIAPGSVSGMLRKLGDLDLVAHRPYYGVELTETGRQLALEIVRHHRLLELYLTVIIGFGWHEVHDQADELEHAISEEFEDRIAQLLGNPTVDPHGDPIPPKAGTMAAEETVPLSTVTLHEQYQIVRVRTQDPDLLCYLNQKGLVPGTLVTLLSKEPYGGSLHLQHSDEQVETLISPAVGMVVCVRRNPAAKL